MDHCHTEKSSRDSRVGIFFEKKSGDKFKPRRNTCTNSMASHERKRKREEEKREEEKRNRESKEEEGEEEVSRRRRSSSPYSFRSSTSNAYHGFQITPTPRDVLGPVIDPFSIEFFKTLQGQEQADTLRIPDVHLAVNKRNHALIKIDVRYKDKAVKSFYVKLFADFRSGWYESGMVDFIQKHSPVIAGGKLGPISHGRCELKDPILGYDLLSELKMRTVSYCSITPSSGLTISNVESQHLISPITTYKWEVILESIRVMFNAFLRSLKSKENLFWFEHGDSNEANYLIDDDGSVRMIDFGNSSFGGYDESIRGDIYFSRNSKSHNGHRDCETFLRVLVRFFSVKLNGIDEKKRETLCSFFKEKLEKKSYVNIIDEFNDLCKQFMKT
jgi:hypothetical protein